MDFKPRQTQSRPFGSMTSESDYVPLRRAGTDLQPLAPLPLSATSNYSADSRASSSLTLADVICEQDTRRHRTHLPLLLADTFARPFR